MSVGTDYRMKTYLLCLFVLLSALPASAIDIKSLFNSDFDVTFGRQNLFYGSGFVIAAIGFGITLPDKVSTICILFHADNR